MRQKLALATLALLAISGLSLLPVQNASALSGSEFDAGRIIEDGVFFKGDSMDAGQIQNFLNAKVPVCDTNGTQPYSGTTAGAYGASKGYPPPYTCLKDYKQNTQTIAPDGYCNGFTAGFKSAAQIIQEVGYSCGISQKVILVTLQKEQSLVTDTWPWGKQYDAATGYACPDTAPCDPNFTGFFKQVYYGARQFKRYAKDSQIFTSYRPYRSNYIQYNPNANCGGTNVYVQNQATSGLYIYTPYQPNAAALANLYGTGDGCSAYGNRNFWRMFSDWFGSTRATNCYFPPFSDTGVHRLYNRGTGNHLLTTDPAEVCNATSIGYLYDGQIMQAAPSDGLPVFRLEKGGRYIFTASPQERDTAVNTYGYRYEGVAMNGVNPATDPSGARPVYRLLTPNSTYVYTLSQYERDALVSQTYKYEGVSFYLKENPGATVIPMHRLYHPRGVHMFTPSAEEKTVATQYYGYWDEGKGYDAINELTPITVPIYRLAGPNGYLYTTNLQERVNATKLGYRDEGIGMFTYGFNDPSLKKIYRLVRGQGGYLYTPSEAEKNAAVNSYGYKLEGVGFLAP